MASSQPFHHSFVYISFKSYTFPHPTSQSPLNPHSLPNFMIIAFFNRPIYSYKLPTKNPTPTTPTTAPHPISTLLLPADELPFGELPSDEFPIHPFTFSVILVLVEFDFSEILVVFIFAAVIVNFSGFVTRSDPDVFFFVADDDEEELFFLLLTARAMRWGLAEVSRRVKRLREAEKGRIAAPEVGVLKRRVMVRRRRTKRVRGCAIVGYGLFERG
ncbi:hypothetical protein EX30DRAFT_39093 [Ascodesmis nigricans]|uniref:Uncharacterized protein n=1 Tax=Ascodesmis nigricans TaxID=341454 RepID=A0A4S2MVX5_9PEZI|nr:hypothetical protein EX30DRAFT_39093 [Ascodesmis nigricans]